MAECVTSPFCFKLRMQRRHFRERSFSHRITNFKTFRRKNSRNGCEFHFSTQKTFELSVFRATDLKISTRLQTIPVNCIGLGTLVDFDGPTASYLVPVVNQALLMGSILLTYMAGVIPVEKSYTSYRKINSDKNPLLERSDISGSSVMQNDRVESKYVLDMVREKLLKSLNALEKEAYEGDIILQYTKRPLSLNAIAEGPKLRLLWASFQQIEKEINNISNISESVGMDDLFRTLSEVIQRSCHSIWATWLEKEFLFVKRNTDKEFVSKILEKVKGDNTIVQNITRSGKKDLYSELLWYLTFGLLRDDCCYDSCIFAKHGISILEDLVIALADGVASLYLEFISVDSDMSSKTNSLDMSFCALSTRELQKLRNEVALNQWLYHNMDTVVSMYEDRFDLCTLESQPIDVPDSSQTEKEFWWKRLTLQHSKTVSHELHCLAISQFSMPIKRTKELRALTGWRYYFSLLLELSDITMPLVRAIIEKASEAISFFLVSLIGRSLGLIYTGIRQSLRWK